MLRCDSLILNEENEGVPMKNPERWMIVANNGEFLIYDVKSPTEIHPLKEHIHRKAAMQEQNFTHDKAGANKHGSHMHRETHKQLEEQAYAKELAEMLNSACSKKKFEWLYLAMAPDLLGYVREHLSKETQKAIHKEVSKDVVAEKPEKIWNRYFQV